MRANPSMLEPSNHKPCSMASLNLWKGMWTFLTTPMMSVNCRLTNRTLAAWACSITRCFIAALSVDGMAVVCRMVMLRCRRALCRYACLRGAAAERGSNLERELQVEACLGIFEVGAAEQLLDALESIDQRIAMHVQVARGAHVVAAGPKKRVQRSHELGAARGVGDFQCPQHVALECPQFGIVGQVEDEPQGAQPGE